ncbi:MAG: thioredoxin domain-containing protein [bacterium]|nr:thioredoxin domain-containing protein [bacterium]
MSSDQNQNPRSNRASRASAARTGGTSSSGKNTSGKTPGTAGNRAGRPEMPPAAAPSAASLSAVGRKRAEERMKEREQQRRRQQAATIIIVAAVAVSVILLAIILRNAPADAPIPESAAARYDGLEATRNLDGFPELGDPDSPVQVTLYSSFDCTACASFHDATAAGLVERVRAGAISLVYVPIFGTGTVTNGRGAAAAAICLSEQDPSAFWELQDAFFSWQGLFGNQSFTDTRLRAAVETLGADVNAFYGCIGSGRPDEIMTRASTQARALANYQSTPTIAINGVVPLNDEDNTPMIDPDTILARIDEEIERLSRPISQPTAVTPGQPGESALERGLIESTPQAESTPNSEAAPESDSTPEVTDTP